MSSQREALEETISQGIGWAEYAWVPQDTGNYNTSRLMFIKSLGKQATDNAIAHLWQRADDPEVVRKLAGTIGGGGGGSMDAYSSDNIAAAYRAREILLTLLLGPRPNGEEAADER